MKKLFLMISFILANLLIQNKAQAQKFVSYVGFISGSATVNPIDQQYQTESVTLDTIVKEQTNFKTEANSQILLVLASGSLVKLFPNTSLHLLKVESAPTRPNFSVSIELIHGTISVYTANFVSSFVTVVNTYNLKPAPGSCFSANISEDRGLIRIKTADKPINYTEGLIDQVIMADRIFVRFERAFAFTSKYNLQLQNALRVQGDRQSYGLSTFALQLTTGPTAKEEFRSLPVQSIGSKMGLFPYNGAKLDDGGYLFLDATFPKTKINDLNDLNYCFDIDDPTTIFEYRTAVIRGGKALN